MAPWGMTGGMQPGEAGFGVEVGCCVNGQNPVLRQNPLPEGSGVTPPATKKHKDPSTAAGHTFNKYLPFFSPTSQ